MPGQFSASRSCASPLSPARQVSAVPSSNSDALRYSTSTAAARAAQDREECLSDAALRVWEKFGTYDPARGSWTAWLTALTRNTALNRARKKSGGSEELSGDLPSAEPTPEERLLQQERRQALERALTALPQRDRLLFYRKYYYRQSTAQIAAELGTTERAVEGRLYRIKKALRKALGGDDA